MNTMNDAVLSPNETTALIEAHGVGTWWWDFNDDRVGWSAGVSAILGIEHRPSEQSQEQYEQMVHPDDQLDLVNPTRTSPTHVLTAREYRILRPNGELRWVRSHGKMIYSRGGRAERIVGVSFDITEARAGLKALKQRDGLMVAIRDLFDVVIWTTDKDGEVTDEVEWWRATGQRGRVDRWNRLQAIHPDDREKVRDAWAEAVRNGKSYATNSRVLWGTNYVPIASRAVSIQGTSGNVEGWIGFTKRQDAPSTDMETPTASGPLTPGQVRAARGFLGWSAEQLAEKSGVSFSTVRRVETPGERGVREQSLAAIRKALERAGIVFTAGTDGRAGVSMK